MPLRPSRRTSARSSVSRVAHNNHPLPGCNPAGDSVCHFDFKVGLRVERLSAPLRELRHTQIQRRNRSHIRIAQREIKDVQILRDMRLLP